MSGQLRPPVGLWIPDVASCQSRGSTEAMVAAWISLCKRRQEVRAMDSWFQSLLICGDTTSRSRLFVILPANLEGKAIIGPP